MKRFFYILIFIGSLLQFSVAQTDSTIRSEDGRKHKEGIFDNFNLRDRLYWGGTIGAMFGSFTYVDLSPLIGIRITKQLSVGVGVIYNYYSYSYLGSKYQTSLYGGRCYARVFPFANKDEEEGYGFNFLSSVFVQAGYDRINRDNPYAFDPGARIWIDNVLVGGGIRYPFTDNISVMATGLWNLNQTPLSPYANPIIQIGFVGGF